MAALREQVSLSSSEDTLTWDQPTDVFIGRFGKKLMGISPGAGASDLMVCCNTEFLIVPMTCISHGLQSKRRVSFSRPLMSCNGSALTVPCTPTSPLACLGHKLNEKRTQCLVIIRLTSPSSCAASKAGATTLTPWRA